MDVLRRRIIDVRRADHARNSLFDDLVQKLDDMQKTMDRNAFIMVLIDGDCMLFLDELVKKGIAGGDEAAKLLRKAVFDYMRYDDNFKHDHKIVIRVYANLRGLSHAYAEKGILKTTSVFTDFVLGFNKAHPLCDFIDAGNHKEAADSKLKDNLNLYVYNAHCKHIIFGASADNGFASFLGSFLIDTEILSRIILLKGLPFATEFASILPKLRSTEFTNIFRGEALADVSMPRNHGRRSIGFDQAREKESQLSGHNDFTLPWRSKPAARFGAIDAPGNETTVTGTWYTTISPEGGNHLPRGENDGDMDSQHESPSRLDFPNSTLSSTSGARPSRSEIEAALIDSTTRRLNQSSRGLDFGHVKHDVELALRLTPDFWGKSEEDEWFLRSKDIIKRAVEAWVKRTGNPPPGNATWIRQNPVFARTLPSPAIPDSSQAHRPVDEDTQTPDTRLHLLIPNNSVGKILRNANNQRIDLPEGLAVHPSTLNGIRDRNKRLCNSHYLTNNCLKNDCDYDHNSRLNDGEYAALLYLSRTQPCPQGSACNTLLCVKGHMCPNGMICKYGGACKFAHLHGIDTAVVA
ncbi:uncharacterized protein PV07_12588 [Cladophialophora immunda]|uniref:C3H1-type domain-containing protein n=1 Tax=Cladophialophora immunda TaxID=569365 RepID=A0A0D2CES5_9EURO|nr:uncharacterized protein PV07_12588 [Cladophialophora immunda]KIW22014.1 hypothetical protein PV07_12588 [Cladophialophora immunda]